MAALRLTIVMLGICCGCQPAASPPVPLTTPAVVSPSAPAVPSSTPIAPEATLAVAAPNAPLPKDLGTREIGDDWPAFLGPTGDSKSAEKGILTTWPKAGPRIVWQRKLGTGYGIGAVSRGRFFQFDKVAGKARLDCLEAETGKEIWHFEYESEYQDLYGYNDGPRCSPVVDGDRVYLYGVEGMLHCLRVEDGEVIWKVDTVKEFGVIQNFFGVGSTPAIEGDLLIAMIGGSPEDSKKLPPGDLDRVEPNGSGVVAFDKYTGRVKYKLGDELASYASLKVATIAGRRWAFAFCRGGLLAFDPATGKEDFHYPWRAKILESVNAAMPVVVDNRVFITETYGPGSSLLAVKPGDFQLVWADSDRKREKAMQCHWNTPVVVDGYLYGSSGRHTENAVLRCIELATGKVMWTEPNTTRCSLLSIDKHFVVLGEYGQVQLIKANPEKFDLVATAELRDAEPAADEGLFAAPRRLLLKYPCWSAPILSHGLLYLRGDDRLLCLELIPEKK